MTYLDVVPVDPAEVGTLYKVTGPNGEPLHGGSGRWPLPEDGQPGAWWDITGDVVACRQGLHLTDAAHLASWTPGTPCVVWRAEVRGTLYRVGNGDKYVCGSARLMPRKPRKGPGPDVLAGRRDRAVDRAAARKARADKCLARDAGPGWAAYLYRTGRRLPIGGAVPVPDRVRKAVDVWRAETDAAADDSRKAQERYHAAMRRWRMPD